MDRVIYSHDTMSYVITLIPAAPLMPPMLAEQLVADLEAADNAPIALDWLAPQRVIDIHIDHYPTVDFLESIHQVCHTMTTDIIIQPLVDRDKQMLISDMDSTMITVECIDELADYVGKKDEVAHITERAMNGELDFTQALNERVALLAGLAETTLEACFNERVKIMPGAPELLAIMKREGAYCLLVSGGFDFFTTRIAGLLGFDESLGNRLEMVDGKLTGKVLPPILDKHSKLQALGQHSSERGIKPEAILAIGDGANDLPMLTAAGLGVAYHAKPHVREQVNAQINYNDLTALIYAQGFEFRPT